jgi:hypothetical protein
MSDYSKITNFAAKDALITGDPNKLVKGTEHDAEYNAIAVAIATKFDSNDIASEEEAADGVSNSKLITPARLAHVLENTPSGSRQLVYKAATTSRSNSASPSNDPDLITTSLVEGTYIVTVFGSFGTNGGTQGASMRFGGSASIRATNPDDSTAMFGTMASNNSSVSSAAGATIQIGFASYPTVGFGNNSSTTTSGAFKVTARVTITSAGTLAFQWAQNTSSGTATALTAGATMLVEQVA